MIEIKYFTAKFCSPCRQFGPIVEKFKQIKRVPVDEDQENKDISVKYRISQIPTLILEKDGLVVASHVGVMSESQLQAWIDEHSDN